MDLIFVVAGAVAVAALARWRGWPAPHVVTAVALAASFLSFVPNLEIDGELLLTATLPPLLYSAALNASFTSFTQAMPHVRRLGVGLVALTTIVVGLVAWLMLPDIGFAAALLLGAIVGPPDAVSAAAIGRKLGLPRRVMTVLSGESLINDATSLTLVRVFAAVAAGATVTVWQGLWEFVLAVVVGVAAGLVFGVVLHAIRMWLDDPTVSSTLGLLMPFGAYILAEHLHGSGVLAVVAMGFYMGYNAPRTSCTQRQHDKPLWRSVDFILESFVFAYVGLQFPDVWRTVTEHSGSGVLVVAIVVFAIVVLMRPAFVFGSYAWGQFWQRLRLRRWKHAVEAHQKDPTSGERDLDKVQEDAAAGRMPQVSYDDLAALSRGWLAVRRKVALEQSRAGNISEEAMRDLFDAMDAEELALDTRGSFRKE